MKTVFITGATKNTGLAIARRFAEAGYNIAISSRSADLAQETADMLAAEFGTNAKGYAMVLDSTAVIAETFREIEKDFGGLDVFVANSAVLGIGVDLLGAAEDTFDEIIDVNVKGTFFCCQQAAELMKRSGGGSIVTIGSVQGNGAVPGRTVYGISKAAISTLVKYMAYELGEYGIRANNVVAGAIHSDRWNDLSEGELSARRGKYPIGRESTESDIANAVYYLGSDLAASITGTDLTIDSGLTACLLPYKKKEN